MNWREPPLDLLAAGAAGVLVVVAAVAGIVLLRRYRARRALLARIEAVAAAHLQDVLLPDGNGGSFHIDFLLLTAAGIVVVDLRDVAGLIFGSEQMTDWAVMHKNRRYTFLNPLGPLYDRMAAVRAIAGAGVPVDGRVVFTDRGSFPKGHPRPVIRLASLASELPARGAGGEAVTARFRPAWDRLCAASSPSPLHRR